MRGRAGERGEEREREREIVCYHTWLLGSIGQIVEGPGLPAGLTSLSLTWPAVSRSGQHFAEHYTAVI